jgi:hypothetical protein
VNVSGQYGVYRIVRCRFLSAHEIRTDRALPKARACYFRRKLRIKIIIERNARVQ